MRLGLRHATLKLGDQWILDHADLQLNERERLGLIGLNGAGKSTLFNILLGNMQLDEGERIISSGVSLGSVLQTPTHQNDSTIAEEVALGLGAAGEAWVRWNRALISGDEHEMGEAQIAMEEHNAWTVESQVDMELETWRLPAHSLIAGLSGGERKRVALAQAWIARPEILFLDEPTNHLDLLGIRQLETAVRDYPGTVFCISHDRAFLDAIITRIVELDRGMLTSYLGNYASYVDQKEKALEEEARHNAKADKFLAQEEVWIRKGIQARRTRNEGRVRRLERLRDLRQQRRERREMNENWTLVSGDRSGKQVAVMEHVSYELPNGRTLIHDFSTQFMRGDRVGIIGPNGVGKSTFLKLLLGELAPTSGKIEQGTRLTTAYFDQMREQLDGQQTVLDMIAPGSDWIEWNGERLHKMGYLLQFGFSPKQVQQPVRSLSGGERQRLLLARLFSQPANFLILDEPTNDLDMDTLDILESTLERYDGTVFLVTHDRQFLDNVATQIVVFEPHGQLKEFPGGYSDWTFWDAWFKNWDDAKAQDSLNARQTMTPSDEVSAPVEPKQKEVAAIVTSISKPLSRKERDLLEALPLKIEQLEASIHEIQTKLADPMLYNQPINVQKQLTDELNQKVHSLETEKHLAYQQWEALEARR